jgi:hypothetical protein
MDNPPLSELDRVNLLAMLQVYGQDQLRDLLPAAEATGRPDVVRLMHLALSGVLQSRCLNAGPSGDGPLS